MKRVRTDRPRKSKVAGTLPVMPSEGLPNDSPWPYTPENLLSVAGQLGLPVEHNSVRFIVGIARGCLENYKNRPAEIQRVNLQREENARLAMKASKLLEKLHRLFAADGRLTNALMSTGASTKDGSLDLGKDPEGHMARIRIALLLKNGGAHIAAERLRDYAKDEDFRIAPSTSENVVLNSAVVQLMVVWQEQRGHSRGVTKFLCTALSPLHRSFDKSTIDSLRRRVSKYIR
jgi:hypothetical protein